jgi:hypothetical protein
VLAGDHHKGAACYQLRSGNCANTLRVPSLQALESALK